MCLGTTAEFNNPLYDGNFNQKKNAAPIYSTISDKPATSPLYETIGPGAPSSATASNPLYDSNFNAAKSIVYNPRHHSNTQLAPAEPINHSEGLYDSSGSRRLSIIRNSTYDTLPPQQVQEYAEPDFTDL